MEEQSNNLITCKICMLPYDSHDKVAKIVQCGHSFCQDCLKAMLNDETIKCPLCKKVYEKVKDFPINFEIMHLVETRRIDNMCNKHKSENLNFFCDTDKILICQLCLLNDHIGHQIIKPQDAEIHRSIKLVNNFKHLYSDTKSLKFQHQNQIKEHFKKVDQGFENIVKHLREVRDMLKFQFYVEHTKTSNQILKLDLLEQKVKKEYELIKMGKTTQFSEDIHMAYEEHSVFFNGLKEKDMSLEKNKHFLEVRSCLDRLDEIKVKIKDSSDTSELLRPEYADIDNILDFLIDGRITSIRYNISQTSNEHKKLVEKAAGNSSTNNEFVKVLMKSIDRGDFVPADAVHLYVDMPILIGWNTTISAPHMHMITLAHLSSYVDKFKDKNLRAIDIGSGSGYMTLSLAKLLGPFSTSIALDHIQEIIDFSRQNISKKHKHFIDSGRIQFVCKEGREGYAEGGPYHIIHVGAAVEEVPQAYLDQLSPGGLIWVPVGPKGGYKKIVLLQKDAEGKLVKQELMSVSYAEMVSVNEQLKISSAAVIIDEDD